MTSNPKKINLWHYWQIHQRLIINMLAGLIILAGFYLLTIRFSPQLPQIPIINSSNINLNTKDDAEDKRDRIQIPKINLEVPIYTGNSEAVLEKGVWNRWPQRGNPVIGGNYILSAHRFIMGLTPSQTRQKSPFYNIHKLETGDQLRVFYQGKWYSYKINKKYSVKPTALYIENASDYPKLTLYSCTLNGSADGRDVIEALPIQ